MKNIINNNLETTAFISLILYIFFSIIRFSLGYYDSLIIDCVFLAISIPLMILCLIKNRNIKLLKIYIVLFLIITFLGSSITFSLHHNFLDLLIYSSYAINCIISAIVYWLMNGKNFHL